MFSSACQAYPGVLSLLGLLGIDVRRHRKGRKDSDQQAGHALDLTWMWMSGAGVICEGKEQVEALL